MATVAADLWPEDLGNSGVKAPVAILREQAVLLGKKTNQLVQAEVSTHTVAGWIQHDFDLLAPALDDYRYRLFSVRHGVEMYPLEIDRKSEFWDPLRGKNEAEYLGILRQLLSSDETKRIVQALLAQSQA